MGRRATMTEKIPPGYFDELMQTRKMLESRYDDFASGKVKLIDGEEAFARLKAKTDAQRRSAT